MPVVLEGIVADAKETGENHRFVFILEAAPMKGEKKCIARVIVTSNEARSARYRQQLAAVKKGQTIRVKGSCQMPESGGISIDGADLVRCVR